MISIKDKIEQIKLARMGPEYRFVAEFFSDMEVKYVSSLKGKTFFFKFGRPVMQFLESGNYLWCHNTLCWEPLEKIVYEKNIYDKNPGFHNILIKKEVRKILTHFALVYFNLSDVTASAVMDHIVKDWQKLKFTDKKN